MEVVHNGLVIVQIVTTLLIMATFWQNYQKVKSNFTLGLLLFSTSMLINAIFNFSMDHHGIHALSDAFEVVSLLFLLKTVRK
ncbi:MAG: hypothetical protein V3V48_07560 [Candidatus Aminicenantaceae bacterium]